VIWYSKLNSPPIFGPNESVFGLQKHSYSYILRHYQNTRHKKKEVLVAFLLNNKPSIALLVLANENIGRIEAV
jgi:hypothetical protein